MAERKIKRAMKEESSSIKEKRKQRKRPQQACQTPRGSSLLDQMYGKA